MTLALVCVAPAPAFANSAPVSVDWSLHVNQHTSRTEPTAIGYWTQSIIKMGRWSGNLSVNVIDDNSVDDFARVKGDLSASIPLADITGLNYWAYIISGDVNGKSDIGYGPGDTLKDPTMWSDPNYNNGYPGPWIQLNLLAGNSTAWFALEKAYVYSTSAYHTWVQVNITDATLFHCAGTASCDPTLVNPVTIGQLKASNPDTTLTAVRLCVGMWAGGTSVASELAGWYSALVSGLAISQSAPMIYHMAPKYDFAKNANGIAEYGTTAYDGMRSGRLGLSSYTGGTDYGRVAIEAGMLLKDVTSWSVKYNVEQGDVDGPAGSGYNPPAFKDPIIYSIDPLDNIGGHPYYNGYLAGYIGFDLDMPPYGNGIDFQLLGSRYVATTALPADSYHSQPATDSLGVWKTDAWSTGTNNFWIHSDIEANPFADGHNFGFYTGTARYGNARVINVRYYMGWWGGLDGLSGAQSVFVDDLTVSGSGWTANFDFESEGTSALSYAIINAPADSAWLIQPDFNYGTHTSGPKPTGVFGAELSDFAASGIVIGLSANQQRQILDTQGTYVNTATGRPTSAITGPIIIVTGPLVHSVVHYYETTSTAADQSPIYYQSGGGNVWWTVRATEETVGQMAHPGSDATTDNFVIYHLTDADGRQVYVIYGFTYKGTYAAAIFFRTVFYPNLNAYTGDFYVFQWSDATSGWAQNRIPDQGDTYTLLASA